MVAGIAVRSGVDATTVGVDVGRVVELADCVAVARVVGLDVGKLVKRFVNGLIVGLAEAVFVGSAVNCLEGNVGRVVGLVA